MHQTTPENTKIGWIGTGVMGKSMCGHLIKAGYTTTVYTRTSSKAEGLVQLGARLCQTPSEVAQASDIIFSIVGFPEDVEAVHLGENGAMTACKPGSIFVDMTTSRPTLAERLAEYATTRGAHSVDAPVSGGDLGAKNAALSIMVGGETESVNRVMPLFELMGKTIVHQGGPGRGQHTKMVNQTLIASGMIAVCEALLYASKAGLDIQTVLRSVSSGAAGSWSLSHLAPRMIHGDYDPGFFVEHFIKDMKIALEEAAKMNLCLPGLALAHQLYQALVAQGNGKSGTQSLILALASLNATTWPPSDPSKG